MTASRPVGSAAAREGAVVVPRSTLGGSGRGSGVPVHPGGVWVDDGPSSCGPFGRLGFAWGCEVCGHLGVDLISHNAAMREALRHIDNDCAVAS